MLSSEFLKYCFYPFGKTDTEKKPVRCEWGQQNPFDTKCFCPAGGRARLPKSVDGTTRISLLFTPDLRQQCELLNWVWATTRWFTSEIKSSYCTSLHRVQNSKEFTNIHQTSSKAATKCESLTAASHVFSFSKLTETFIYYFFTHSQEYWVIGESSPAVS